MADQVEKIVKQAFETEEQIQKFTNDLVDEVLEGGEGVGTSPTRRELLKLLYPVSRRFLQLHEELEQVERGLAREERRIGKLNVEARRIRELHPLESEDHSPRTEKKRWFSWSWKLGR